MTPDHTEPREPSYWVTPMLRAEYEMHDALIADENESARIPRTDERLAEYRAAKEQR